MKISELKSSLEKDYDLVAFVDLADLYSTHSAVFKLFTEVRKDEFEDHERIVLYSKYTPEKSFLDHIYRAAKKVDIGEYFIIIICSSDLSDTKLFANKGYGAYDSLCPMPFLHVDLDQKTKINKLATCCKIKQPHDHGSITDFFLNDQTSNLRKQMLQGKKPAECRVCWENEAYGVTSFRQHAWDTYHNIVDIEAIDNIQIRSVTWNPTSLCNFKCRICNSNSSSSIAAEEGKLIFQDIKNNNLVIDELIRLPYLEKIHILGGEPLMWPGLKDLVDKLIEYNIAKNIHIEFNTNGSKYPEALINKMVKNFRQVEFHVSLDDVEQRFEITRGSKWDIVDENIKRLSAIASVQLCVTVNLQNVLYLDELTTYANSLNLPIIWWYLERPDFYCIDNATSELAKAVMEKYSAHPVQELRSIAMRIKNANGNSKDFIENTHKIDTRRQQNFSKSHKELYELMGVK